MNEEMDESAIPKLHLLLSTSNLACHSSSRLYLFKYSTVSVAEALMGWDAIECSGCHFCTSPNITIKITAKITLMRLLAEMLFEKRASPVNTICLRDWFTLSSSNTLLTRSDSKWTESGSIVAMLESQGMRSGTFHQWCILTPSSLGNPFPFFWEIFLTHSLIFLLWLTRVYDQSCGIL